MFKYLPNEVENIIMLYVGNKCHTCNKILQFNYFQFDYKFIYCSRECYNYI